MANEKPDGGETGRPSGQNAPWGKPQSNPTNIRAGWEGIDRQQKSLGQITENQKGDRSGDQSRKDQKG